MRVANLKDVAEDEYLKQALRQNEGKDCEHCGSDLGHYRDCFVFTGKKAEPTR